jgi:uncharacterized protein (DUF1697 family)
MPRYAAFLRGISPMNARMPDLKRGFESAGFGNVRTVLSSGNVVFDADDAPGQALEQRAEAALQNELGRGFLTIVRSLAALEELLASDPYAAFDLPVGAKCVVTFLRAAPDPGPPLPAASGDAWVLCQRGHEVFSAYLPSPQGTPFMTLIEATFGKAVTTRTWATVQRVARA